MGDVGDLYREVREHEARARAARKEKNLAILRASVLPFEYRNGGDVVLVRNKANPALDFWPSTNKWKVGDRYMMGDADALIDYLKRRAMR